MYHRHIVGSENQTIFWTVVSGTLVFVLGQLILKFILEPIKEYKGVVGEIDNQLKFRANILLNSSDCQISEEVVLETSHLIRRLSCDFESRYKQIPIKWLWSMFKIIPSQDVASKSAVTLLRASNIVVSRTSNHVDRMISEISELRKNLNIIEL